MGMVSDPVLQTLTQLGVEHEIIPVDPALADTTLFCEHYGYPLEQSANTILVASKKEPKVFAACVILATTKLDVNRRVRELLGVKRASFATADEMRQLTGMEVGGLTPFGLPEGVPLWVDRRVFDAVWVIVGGGGRNYKVKLAPQALLVAGGRSIDDLAVALAG